MGKELQCMKKLAKSFFFAVRSRLKYKLALIYMIVFILQCGVILYSYYSIANDNKEESIDQNLKLLQQANNNYFSDVIEEINQLMERAFVESVFWNDRSLADSDKDYMNDNVKIDQILSSMYSYGSFIDSVYLYFHRNGKLYIMDEISHKDIPSGIYANNTFMIPDPRVGQYSWYRGALGNKGGLFLSRNINIRFDDDSKGEYVLNFSKSLFNPLKRDELISVISINISYEFFKELADQLTKPEETLRIVTEDGTIIYSTDGGEIFTAMAPEQAERVSMPHAGDSFWYAKKTQGKTQSVVLINQSEQSGWYMMKEIPYDVLMGDVRKKAVTNLSFILVIFIAGLVLVMTATMRITTPIKKIATAMERFKEGHEPYMTYRRRIDEIGKLNKSFNKMTDKINNLILSEYKAKIGEKQARLEALQAQINPHFLNNTLQIVSSIAVEKRITEIEKISEALSSILRYSLSKNNALVTLRKELVQVEHYMLIQRYRYEDRLQYEVQIDDDLLDEVIPVLTLQSIVENAIKHGIEPKVGKGTISIKSARKSDDRFLLVVEDTGRGVSESEAARLNEKLRSEIREEISGWGGRGLVNINDRIRYSFGDAYGLTIRSRPDDGFWIAIELPRNRQKQMAAVTKRYDKEA